MKLSGILRVNNKVEKISNYNKNNKNVISFKRFNSTDALELNNNGSKGSYSKYITFNTPETSISFAGKVPEGEEWIKQDAEGYTALTEGKIPGYFDKKLIYAKVRLIPQVEEFSDLIVYSSENIQLRVSGSLSAVVTNSVSTIQNYPSINESRIVREQLYEILSKRSCMDILAKRNEITKELAEGVKNALEKMGINLLSLTIFDIVPPPKVLQLFNDRIASKIELESKLDYLQSSLDQLTLKHSTTLENLTLKEDIDSQYFKHQIMSKLNVTIDCIEMLSPHLNSPQKIEAANFLINSNFLQESKSINYSQISANINSMKELLTKLDGTLNNDVAEAEILQEVVDTKDKAETKEEKSEESTEEKAEEEKKDVGNEETEKKESK